MLRQRPDNPLSKEVCCFQSLSIINVQFKWPLEAGFRMEQFPILLKLKFYTKNDLM